MLTIDTNDMMISITRGDYASIVFSAVTEDQEEWHPSNVGVDTLTFAVAKDYGEDPLISVSNVYNGDETAFWTIEIESDDWPQDLAFGNYVWDLQLSTSTGDVTIIGKTDEIKPKFKVWGEVAQEV